MPESPTPPSDPRRKPASAASVSRKVAVVPPVLPVQKTAPPQAVAPPKPPVARKTTASPAAATAPAQTSAAPSTAKAPAAEPRISWRIIFENVSGWGASLVFHFALMLILMLWVLDIQQPASGDISLSLFSEREVSADLTQPSPLTEFEAPSDVELSDLSEMVEDPLTESAMAALAESQTATADATAMAAGTAPGQFRSELGSISRESLHQEYSAPKKSSNNAQNPRRRSAADGVRAAEGVASAATGLMADIKGEMAEGDIFLVWLLDASVSLFEDRQKLATTLEPFYAELSQRDKDDYRLNSAVVAYGIYPIEVQKSTKFSTHTLAAMRGMPIDPSGLENVSAAIQYCLKRYASKARGRMRIVLWTDESGDDFQMLEQTIAACNRVKATVHVVGPSSVLGSDRGLQSWTDKASGYKFLLPVTRGPDSCLPERVMLPYWFDTASSAGSFAGGTVADGMPWYGGALRERLLSGLGPYALTRLALETGGTFTLLDRPGDKSPFSLEAMKPYFPDYGNGEEILESIKSSPLRMATWQAVMKTYQPVNLAPPKMRFYNDRQVRYPYRELGPSYRAPAEFRQLLLPELQKQVPHVVGAATVIEDALKCFGSGLSPSEYDLEPSPRWRAWYDLTRGRLLAMSIRHREYAAACRWIIASGNLKPTTNYLTFAPSARLFTEDEELTARMKEALKLLERCRDENKGTPWELLAQWELENAFGVQPVQHIIPVPKPSPPGPPPPPEPKIVLPKL